MFLWSNASKQIASQYMITSLFGIMPFILAISVLTIAVKANEWLGMVAFLSVIGWWLANHYIGLISQFAHKRFKPILAFVLALLVFIQWLIPSLSILDTLLNPFFSIGLLLVSLMLAFGLVRKAIEKREVYEQEGKAGLLESLPVLSFKNPVFQLEWALLVRNKRTRSNLLLGLVSVSFTSIPN